MRAPGLDNPVSRWIGARLDDAADAAVAGTERLRPLRRVALVEQPDGSFAGDGVACQLRDGSCVVSAPLKLRGSDVEFRLSPQRCVFRELDLPAGARDFLDGVVRAQLDRLTPWRASEAAFGWRIDAADANRLRATVAVTKRQAIAPLLAVPADGVRVTTWREEGKPPFLLLSRRSGAASRRSRWRGACVAALGVALLAAAAALVAQWTLIADLADQADALTADLAPRRAALLRREHAGDDPASQALDARKRATPSAVIVLEALTRAVPDDAYLTHMQLAGDKLEFSGIATNAAGLVKRLEQSPHFSHAAFTAPTTRGADERETFRIEAHVTPRFEVGP